MVRTQALARSRYSFSAHPGLLIRGIPCPPLFRVLNSQDVSSNYPWVPRVKGYIKEIFLGSVAHNVTRLSPCPVLLVPPEKR